MNTPVFSQISPIDNGMLLQFDLNKKEHVSLSNNLNKFARSLGSALQVHNMMMNMDIDINFEKNIIIDIQFHTNRCCLASDSILEHILSCQRIVTNLIIESE